MKIIWRKIAEADRECIFDYISQNNPNAALELDADFDTKIELVAQQPKLYRPGRVRGTREIVVRPNYVIVYRIDSGTVVVLRVLHAAQQWPPAKP
ncbi:MULTISPECIES: type II toxin-antitoxin system RelE/ParE family toxin [Photorhabdus]|uniref:Type II toxin-antitoxin system mRNA interferase toxin, RelE/StbE family n=1 Tax=Photorhabdus khanii subsp. guanajuatensis TaxID=2100166 RepID=A0A4R4JUU6_9GAMM|nr:type II toxin-antitoxin system RelE/ParE family toxin [Photorhabdus khanii]TDB57309.1 type II toxin-antitoxin system mRNA interferase toxin, RelE/StbE family [Photorhabdus khanii subsp. guanajuatensis]